MLIVGAAWGVGRGNTLIRAVSFFGPPFVDRVEEPFSSRTGVGRSIPPGLADGSAPGGFGNGCNNGEESFEDGAITGGRRGGNDAVSAASSVFLTAGILGGNRVIPLTGAREGSTIRAVSRFVASEAVEACSGRGGSAMRTVSFFGSAMDKQQR
jgi:hypothetical protein